MPTGDIAWRRVIFQFQKKYRLRRIYERTVHHRFWLASYERLNLRSTKYKFKREFNLNFYEPNDKMFANVKVEEIEQLIEQRIQEAFKDQ